MSIVTVPLYSGGAVRNKSRMPGQGSRNGIHRQGAKNAKNCSEA